MTDLHTMMESKSLNECKDEINSQFVSLARHDNVMKAAVLASFLLLESADTIRRIDPEKFLNSLRDILNRQIDAADEWKHNGSMMSEHLDKNMEVISAFEGFQNEAMELSEKIAKLLAEFDSVLKRICIDHSRKSIAEIEAELQKLPHKE